MSSPNDRYRKWGHAASFRPCGSAEESNLRAAFITGYGSDNSVVGCGQIADPTPGADEALIEVRSRRDAS